MLGKPKHAVSNRVTMVMIAKKPTINIALAQRSLYGREIHGQLAILTVHGGTEFTAELVVWGWPPRLSRPSQAKRARVHLCNTFFLTPAGKVSHAVRNTNRGALVRIFIK